MTTALAIAVVVLSMATGASSIWMAIGAAVGVFFWVWVGVLVVRGLAFVARAAWGAVS